MQKDLPQFVHNALNQLTSAGYEAFVVGGSIRDLYIGRDPKDFDMTTNATPEQIQEVFEDTVYNNAFGTVVVRLMNGVDDGAKDVSKDALDDGANHDAKREEIEMTPYRAEAEYSDNRHPDTITFGVSLAEDLQRRDFTINAMAYDGQTIVDPFNGRADCDAKIIRTVGTPEERFGEDALRMIRATRFAAQLNFSIEPKTFNAIQLLAPTILNVSWERIRDELMKIVAADNSFRGMWLLYTGGLLKYIFPELIAGVGVEQNKHHIYTVFMHNLLSMQFCPSDDSLVRFASLLHDIGKPQTKEGEGSNASFHNHEHVGGDIVRGIMKRLQFSKRDVERVSHLVDQHMFYYNTDEITDAGVRRLVKRMGREHLDDLMAVRIADRMGSGCQKEKPFKLVELERRIRQVEKDPMDTTMLKIDGHDIMQLTGMQPGREIGVLMNALLEDVLEDPSLNTKEYLTQRAKIFFEAME